MRKFQMIAVATVLTLPLLLAAECETSGPDSDEPQDPQDSGSCNVTARGTNSNNEFFIGLDCNLDGAADSAVVLPGPETWPLCNVNTYYPACKNA